MAGSTHDDESLTRTVIARPDGIAKAGAPADDRTHYLVIVEGEAPGRRFEVGDRQLVIGRAKPADIVVADALVSRSHCRVGLVMGEMFVADEGSSNGTFVGGARISGPRLVSPGDRFSVGTHVFEHEWRSRREVQAARAVDGDLENAKHYVRSLLPSPIVQGPIVTDWVLLPSAKLGGDLFGYHYIDARTFAIYLLDVSGHGIDAALHAVAVTKVLCQAAVAGPEGDPAQVMRRVNEAFPMESHGGMLASLWYGVFDLGARSLAFTSAGHHAAYLVGPDRARAAPLETANVLIGMMPGYAYRSAHAEVAPGSSLYLFSDGVFEIETADGREWGLEDFLPLLVAPAEPGTPESQRILQAVRSGTGRQSFADDFTLVVSAFG